MRKGRRAGKPAWPRLAVDEEHLLPRHFGGGKLRLQVWTDKDDTVVRYSLAYINASIYPGDHGRVLGYDDAHGYHHRHYFGEVQAVEFISYEETLNRFEREWRAIADEYGH